MLGRRLIRRQYSDEVAVVPVSSLLIKRESSGNVGSHDCHQLPWNAVVGVVHLSRSRTSRSDKLSYGSLNN